MKPALLSIQWSEPQGSPEPDHDPKGGHHYGFRGLRRCVAPTPDMARHLYNNRLVGNLHPRFFFWLGRDAEGFHART